MRSDHFSRQNDPSLNPQFRRRWNDEVCIAQRLDREADCELMLGHHLTAEHLSPRAAEMREARRCNRTT